MNRAIHRSPRGPREPGKYRRKLGKIRRRLDLQEFHAPSHPSRSSPVVPYLPTGRATIVPAVPTFLPHLRTTMVQAFARTIVDESRKAPPDSPQARLELVDSVAPPSATVLPSTGDLVGDHYRLVRLLGQGMFGKVYVAQREDVPEHQAALKILPRSLYAGRNVERELVMLATVGHPNVVQLKDHGTTRDYVWLTMPVYKGETLAERLLRGPLDLREAHDIFRPIAHGLEALHAAGLRHQDVKPENIYLAVFAGRVHPILLDLGVAAEKDATFVAGTALYAAPEQVAVLGGAYPGVIPLSEKMDTYGVATTLLMALVGPDLFPGEKATDRNELAEAHEIRAREPIAADAIPSLEGPARAAIQKTLAGWLALDQHERPSMNELGKELDVLLEPEREVARAEERRRSRQKTTIMRFKAAVGAMLLIGCGVAGVMYSKRETLRVASELEKAKKMRSESFDKLETCAASHKMAKMDVASCAAERDKDRAQYKQALEEVEKTGTTSEAERARQLQGYATRIKACEDLAASEKRTCGEEQLRRDIENARQKGALTALTQERDAEQAATAQTKLKLAESEKKIELLTAEKTALTEERDALKTAAAKASAALAAPPHPGAPTASAAPVAGSNLAPTASAAVVTALPPAALPPAAPPPAALPPAALPPAPPTP
jgi:eukaryotic-like serine/threonine-protein kinase